MIHERRDGRQTFLNIFTITLSDIHAFGEEAEAAGGEGIPDDTPVPHVKRSLFLCMTAPNNIAPTFRTVIHSIPGEQVEVADREIQLGSAGVVEEDEGRGKDRRDLQCESFDTDQRKYETQHAAETAVSTRRSSCGDLACYLFFRPRKT